jgi:hypothetical protein
MTSPLLPLAVLLAAATASESRPHPAVRDGTATCVSCHATRTPAIVAEWESGRHGLLLVQCFVCHGSTGKDFTAHPAGGRRCEGCHADQVSSVAAPKGKAQSCFACHAPHTLAAQQGKQNPHIARP